MKSPTSETYDALNYAFEYFNRTLFGGRLPNCLITLQRSRGAEAHFAGRRFGTRDRRMVTDEIALNPDHFAEQCVEEILSSLVHEMAHLEQHHFGTPSRGDYHNKQWGRYMRAVGLIPSRTAAPGGKDVGEPMSHYIEPGGRFELTCAALMRDGFRLDYVDIWPARRKNTSKAKHTCPVCMANAWATAATKLICGTCHVPMKTIRHPPAVESLTAQEPTAPGHG